MADDAIGAWIEVAGPFDDPPDDPTAAEVASWLAEIESVRADVERFLTP